MTATRSVCGLLAASLLCAGGSALAQQFSGRVVTMIANYSAGGPVDIDARLVARHLPKYLQGAASVVVRNVGGAGGNIAINQLGTASERDRLNVGFFTWDALAQLIQEESLQVRYNDLKFIAGFRQPSLLYIRRDTPPGILRPADVAKAPRIRAGGLSPSNSGTVRMNMALDLLGVKYETIAGYKGLRDIELAVQQGDLNLTSTSLSGWYGSVKPNLVDTGIVLPLLQYDYERPDGTPGRNPALPDVPSFSEVYREIMGPGAAPSGERWQAVQLLTRITNNMFRTVFMPPNAPQAAVDELRGAFEKLANDAAYIADYEKLVKVKPQFVIGAQGEAIIAELGKVEPSLLNFFRQYINARRY